MNGMLLPILGQGTALCSVLVGLDKKDLGLLRSQGLAILKHD